MIGNGSQVIIIDAAVYNTSVLGCELQRVRGGKSNGSGVHLPRQWEEYKTIGMRTLSPEAHAWMSKSFRDAAARVSGSPLPGPTLHLA